MRLRAAGDRFAVFDPGLMRLASALRAVLGTAVSLAVLTALDQPATALLTAGFTAMVTSLAVSDPHPRDQLVTLALGTPLFLVALAAGTVLAPYPAAAGCAFLVLIHLAVHARRYGARGQGLGIFAFMGFFLAQFTGAGVAQLPRMGLAVLVASGAVVVVCHGLGLLSADRVLRWLWRAVDVRLRDIAALLAEGQDATALQRGLDGLHAVVLLIENWLPADRRDRRKGTARQAVQVTAASALSILGGHLVSPDHWYWAVVATWVVFLNTESAKEVLLQSARRLVGTVLGAVFGYGLATLAVPHGPLLVLLLLLFMFGMFYTPSSVYWAVTFFITGGLSMVLALLDEFSAQVLVLRVQETALGVACGALAALLVLPSRGAVT